MLLSRIANSLRLRIRLLLGKGFTRQSFERFYVVQGQDAWSYGRNAYNEERFRFIVDAIPPGVVERALEVGCAEGQMTRHLAPRVQSLLAMDFVEEALRRARSNCSGIANVEFVLGDVRDGLPGGTFDLILCSDVLYYLSQPELSAVLEGFARSLAARGALVAAEFSPGTARLPSRLDDVIRLCRQRPDWSWVSERALPLRPDGDGVRVAVFQRSTPGS